MDDDRQEGYTGPINVGDTFVWEPKLPAHRERITVTAIVGHQIKSRGRFGEHWNDESRFREAVISIQKQSLEQEESSG